MQEKSQELQKLLEDIKYIRGALQQNGDELRKLLYTLSYRLAFWFCALAAVLFAFLYHYFIKQYGSFSAIPSGLKTVLIITTVASFVLAGFIKNTVMVFMKKLYPEATILDMIVRLIGKPLLLTYAVLILLMTYLSAFVGWSGLPVLIFPVVTIGFGLIFSIVGSIFSLLELILCGLLLLIPAALSIPFILADPLSVWIWMGATYGGAFVITALYIEVRLRLTKSKD